MSATFFLYSGLRMGSKLKKGLAKQGLYEVQPSLWAIKRCVIHSLYNNQVKWVLSGSLRYDTSVNIAAIREIEANLSANRKLLDIAPDLGGQFCLIHADKERLTIVVDSLGIYPVYKWESSNSEEGIALSDSQHFLGEHISPFILGQSIAESISTAEGITAQPSMYRDVKRLPSCSVIKIQNGCAVECVRRYRGKKNKLYLINSCLPASFLDLLGSYLNSWASNFPCYMDLTGGYDTDLVLKICQNIEADIVARMLTSLGDPESNIAKKRAHSAQIPFKKFIVSDEDVLRFHMVPQQGGRNVAFEYYRPSENRRMITFTGMGGTELCTAMFPTLKESDVKNAIQVVTQEKFKLSPNLGSFLPGDSIYQRNVLKALNHCSEELDIKCIDRAALFWVSVFCRSYHGSVIQSAARACTLYSPFLESNTIDILLNIPKSMKFMNSVYGEVMQQSNTFSAFSEFLNQPKSQVDVMSGYVFDVKPVVKLGSWVKVLESANILRPGVATTLTFEEAERFRAVASILGYAKVCTGG